MLVEVRDSGTGLDPQGAEQVFEAFYTTKAEGIGIGLSISRSIVEAHGGRLWASPNAPHGYTCGLMSLAVGARRRAGFYLGAVVTFVLGAAFLALELREFADMIARGADPQRSAFLSAFFTLVGCHGLHVTAGLIWLVVMMAQVAVRGFRANVERRLLCFSSSGTRSTSFGSGCSRLSI